MSELWLAVSPQMFSTYTEAAAKYNATVGSTGRDSGFDLYCEADSYSTYGGAPLFLKFGVLAACVTPESGYWLMPRSSISKTPLMCANSMGLIDAGYRGALMGAVRHVQESGLYSITQGTRLFQVVSGSALPWLKVHIVSSVDEFPTPWSARGTGGFGSTGL
jgi:dUTP pyrophosphatase